MDDTILDDWFTKSQAAAALRVSEKTIERLATKGHIRRATRKRPGVRPSPVYCPKDLDRVKNAQTAQVVVMPPQADAGELPVPASRAGEFTVFLQSLITGANVPLRDKLFLTIKEAARFAGLPQATIRRLIHAAAIPAVKAGGWRIKRSELEKLDLGHLVDLSDKPVLIAQNKGLRR